jgi:hypothetical protein
MAVSIMDLRIMKFSATFRAKTCAMLNNLILVICHLQGLAIIAWLPSCFTTTFFPETAISKNVTAYLSIAGIIIVHMYVFLKITTHKKIVNVNFRHHNFPVFLKNCVILA